MIRWRVVTTAVLIAGLAGAPMVGTTGGDRGAVPAAADAGRRPDVTAPAALAGTVHARTGAGEPAVSPPAGVVLDDSWNTGFYTSALIDPSGRIHVAYYADGAGSVRLASCGRACVEPVVRELAPVSGIGTDVVLVGDRVVVSFLDLDTRTVQLASCPAAVCDDVDRQPVAAVDAVGPTRLAVAPSGDLVVAYPALGGGVTLARCHRLDCRRPTELALEGSGGQFDLASSADGTVGVAHLTSHRHVAVSRCTATDCRRLVTTAGRGAFPSVDAAPDGTLSVAYHAVSAHDLRVITCPPDLHCREVVVDDTPEVGYFSAVRVRPSGLPLVAHHSEAPAALHVADCRTRDCSVVVRNLVDRRGAPGEHLSLTLDAGGAPRIAHHDAASRTLRLTTCGEPGCAAPPGSEHGGASLSVARGADGTPLVAWRDTDTLDLRLSRCPGGSCDESAAVDSSGDVGLRPNLQVDGDHIGILHQDARSHGLRLATCATDCDDPYLAAVATGDHARRLASSTGPDGTTSIVFSGRDGTVHHGRCSPPACGGVAWSTVGYGRRDGPLATAATASGTTATAFSDPSGALVAICSTTCVRHRLGSGVVTDVGIAAAGDAVVALTRDRDGRISLHRCSTDGCSTAAGTGLVGTYTRAAVSASPGRVAVAAETAGGSVQLSDCTRRCTVVAELEPPQPRWAIDVHTDGQGTVVATLGADGPWTADCAAAGCSAGSHGADHPGGRAVGFIGSQ